MQLTADNAVKSSLFQNHNFCWLFSGSVISLLGEQFTLIALPWLVLQITHDPLALGTVLALMGIPRAALMLAGGAIVDRYSSKQVLLVTKAINGLLLAILAGMAFCGIVQINLIYLLALLLGTSSAFSIPAGNAILPQTIPTGILQAANGTMMGLRQIAALLGPVMAGALIIIPVGKPNLGLFDGYGMGLAFSLDAVSFWVSLVMLFKVAVTEKNSKGTSESVIKEVSSALKFFWQDRDLRTLCTYFAAIACLVGGPIQVALPILASTQLPNGAASLGILISGYALGSLLGMTMAGLFPNWRLGTLGMTILVIDAMSGLAFVPLGHIQSTLQGIILLTPMGLMGGFVQVAVFTWLQKRVPTQMMGRFMSLFMLIFLGLAPLASLISGLLLKFVSPSVLLTGAGIALFSISLSGVLLTTISRIDHKSDAPSDR